MSEWKANRKGTDLYEQWRLARARRDSMIARMREADKELAAAQEKLGRWAAPDDIKAGESIGVWFGDVMVVISATYSLDGDGSTSFSVKERPRVRKEDKEETTDD